MRDLGTIVLEDFPEERRKSYGQRQASRAVLRDADQKIALLEVSKSGYWKLPGGGLDPGEDYPTALARECQEEVGCAIRITGEVGLIVEYRDQRTLRQESHCYLAEVFGEKGEPAFEEGERDEGFRLHWLTDDEALIALRTSQPTTYDGQYITIRDLKFLEAALTKAV